MRSSASTASIRKYYVDRGYLDSASHGFIKVRYGASGWRSLGRVVSPSARRGNKDDRQVEREQVKVRLSLIANFVMGAGRI